jgi:hypothetical protein
MMQSAGWQETLVLLDKQRYVSKTGFRTVYRHHKGGERAGALAAGHVEAQLAA